MKRETLYLWIIAMLVLVNVLQLATFFFQPRPPRQLELHQNQGFRERAVEILNLTEEQKEQFYNLAEKHNTEINELNKEANSLTADYFYNPTEEALQAIQSIQSKKIKITEKHFNEIEAILTQKQHLNYQNFKKEAIQIIIR